MNTSKAILAACLLCKSAAGAADTISPDAIRGLADEAVNIIGGDDSVRKLMYGTADVESNYGRHPNTYRPGYHGGPFQVDEAGFKATQDVRSHPGLLKKYEAIRKATGVQWPNLQWKDLRNPKYSALAARLYYSLSPDKVPASRWGRAKYWKNLYNRSGKGRALDYIRRTDPRYSLNSAPVTKGAV